MRRSEPTTSKMTIAALALMLTMTVADLSAQTCSVPGTHATIQQAVDDPTCSEVALAAQTYPESIVLRRSVSVIGPVAGGAVIRGLVLVAGVDTVVALQHIGVENGCTPDALRTTGGAEVVGDHLEVVRSSTYPCPLTADAIFVDGFESGNTSVWSSTTP